MPASWPLAAVILHLEWRSTRCWGVRCGDRLPQLSSNPRRRVMKRSLIVFVLALAGSAGLHAQEQGAAVETQRDANQQNRIEQGLQSGQLNTREAGHLEREEQHIDRQEAHDLKQGGALTPQEKAQINREQNQVSHDIYRDKHNATTGNPNSASSQRMQADVQRNANQQQRIANGVNNGS